MHRVGLSTWEETGAGRQIYNLQLRPRRADRVHAFHKAAITKQLLAARCNVDLQTNHGATALQVAERKGQEDADRAMKEHLEEEDKDAAAAAVVSQKKRRAEKAGKERLPSCPWAASRRDRSSSLLYWWIRRLLLIALLLLRCLQVNKKFLRQHKHIQHKRAEAQITKRHRQGLTN